MGDARHGALPHGRIGVCQQAVARTTSETMLDRRLSVAPMMDWTDPACRYLLRLISRHTLLYTEMVPAQAVWHGRVERFLAHHASEHPLAVQFGGADAEQLAFCAREAEAWGYDEVNLNVGCPSDRVQSGRFGACLMAEPGLVAELVAAMREATTLPVTVKTRIGIDHQDDYASFLRFVDTVAEAGCGTFIIHARKAWLKGLSPRQNREIPPLRYEFVEALKRDRPGLEVIINGGITTLAEAEAWLEHVDGVMIGREAYHNPYLLAEADRRLFGDSDARPPSREAVVAGYREYVAGELARGARLSRMSRHLVGLFQGLPGARAWRRTLSEGAARADAGTEVIDRALAEVTDRAAPEAAGMRASA
nr:tRNA dihydrouridine(20/20a) synthase DusA [Spiribacter halobius]